ncbi:hypothetical protein [Psychromicrobium lacuslunae]|uniref:Polysaccharide biosynthesis protein n=1 Tax=Psychromicrobium lacuslunae TaxID=1618207 RepID=A0A0D4BZ65_9MICC|nr:hypothetical protein [Psychromicrobium lacuslunae]AJT41411.1 hypothetical protein UM93_07580 [Psychromicrobium lacuslunae]
MSSLEEGTSPASGAGPVKTGRNSILYLVGALMQGLGMVLVQPFAIRMLNNDAQWQELYLSVSVIQIGVVLASAGLPLAITKAWFAPDGHAKARAISGFLCAVGLLLGLLAGLVCWFLMAGSGESLSFTIALVSMGLLASVLAGQAILRAQERPVVFVLLSIGSSVFAYLVGLLAMLLMGAKASNFMVGFGLAVLLTAAAAVLLTRPTSPFAVSGAAKEALKIGLPVLPHTGALMLMTQGAAFLLAAVAVRGVSGDWGKVQIFVLGTITLLGALNNAWVPAIMSVSGQQRVERMRSTMRTASIAGLGIVVVAAAGANVVTHIIAVGREDLIPVAQIMPLVAMGYLLYLNASTLLFADSMTWLLAIVTPVVLLIGVGVTYFPASQGNLVAVAVALVISFFLLGVGYFVVSWRRARGGWSLLVFAICSLAAAGYVLLLLMLPRDIITGLLTIVVVGVLLCLGFLAWRLKKRMARRIRSTP